VTLSPAASTAEVTVGDKLPYRGGVGGGVSNDLDSTTSTWSRGSESIGEKSAVNEGVQEHEFDCLGRCVEVCFKEGEMMAIGR